MPNDAKLGLIVGVGLVIAVAVVFFRKEPLAAQSTPEVSTSSAVHAISPPPAPPRGQLRAVPATPTSLPEETKSGQRHVVQEGETLFNLALHYYGDGEKFVDIYRANRDVLKTPEPLTPGTVLFIPQAGE